MGVPDQQPVTDGSDVTLRKKPAQLLLPPVTNPHELKQLQNPASYARQTQAGVFVFMAHSLLPND